jgi:hypothetical protein
MAINEINVELSKNFQRYVNACCESEFDGKIDGFAAGCCKCRGGVAVAVWCSRAAELQPIGVHDDGSGLSLEVVEEV